MEDATNAALVADDDEFFRMAISSILLSRLGMTGVIETGSFDEAVERLEKSLDVSLALFDLSMPGMSSAANLRTVRELFPSVKVAVVSASQRREDILAALEAGVHGYVPKGLGVDDLMHALKFIMGGSVYVPPSLADVSHPPTSAPTVVVPDTAPGSDLASLPSLTPRQQEVFDCVVQGLSNKEIARKLDLSEGTVKIHLAALFRNLGVKNRVAAAALGGRIPSSAQEATELSRRRKV